jgi:glutamate transport system substrate-binding protein
MATENPLGKVVLDRRQAIALGLGGAATLGLAACSGGSPAPAPEGGSTSDSTSTNGQINTAVYDTIIAGGKVADDADIAASTWASKVKQSGTLRVGGVETSTLFSLRNADDNSLRGFDAGIFQLLARYVLGDQNKYQLTKVTSDTRESVLTNDQVDCVFATYSITPARKEVISFAGPYYTSQQAILVAKSNETIKGIDDLADKKVAVQSGSTGPGIVAEFAPKAITQEFSTDEEARTALEQGRVDAYVIDQTMQMGAIVKNPGKYKIVGEPFGPKDNYGIGMPKDSDGVDFINAFLKKIEDDGTWTALWQVAIGDRTDVKTVPEPPAIGA